MKKRLKCSTTFSSEATLANEDATPPDISNLDSQLDDIVLSVMEEKMLLKTFTGYPAKFRYQYKITNLAYRHFQGYLPLYLSSSLCTYEPSRSLRSSKEKLLKIPKQNLKSFGERSFSFVAPTVWNSLPADLRNLPTLSQFKSNLKTFLFTRAFLQI